MVLYSDNAEAVEWINMCWRKVRMTLLQHEVAHCVDMHLPRCGV